MAASAPPNRIRELRETLGLSQGQLAARAGVTPLTIRNLEAGRFQPNLRTARAIQRAFGAGSLEHVFPAEEVDDAA